MQMWYLKCNAHAPLTTTSYIPCRVPAPRIACPCRRAARRSGWQAAQAPPVGSPATGRNWDRLRETTKSFRTATGWPFRLYQTSCWHHNKGCVVEHGPHTKTELLFWCQLRFESTWMDTLYVNFRTSLWKNFMAKRGAWAFSITGQSFAVNVASSSCTEFSICFASKKVWVFCDWEMEWFF